MELWNQKVLIEYGHALSLYLKNNDFEGRVVLPSFLCDVAKALSGGGGCGSDGVGAKCVESR